MHLPEIAGGLIGHRKECELSQQKRAKKDYNVTVYWYLERTLCARVNVSHGLLDVEQAKSFENRLFEFLGVDFSYVTLCVSGIKFLE